MAVWSGLGMNWGNDFTANGVYTNVPATAPTELDYLKSIGVAKLRISLPGYTDSNAIARWQDAIILAKSKGFYINARITPGVSIDHATFLGAYRTAVLARVPFLIANSVDMFEIGNEMEGNNSDFTNSTLQSDLKQLGADVKSAGYIGLTSYAVSGGNGGSYLAEWNAYGAGGLGGLDRIGYNVYGGWGVGDAHRALFISQASGGFSAFGSKFYLSEWNLEGGTWSNVPQNDVATVELANRYAWLRASGIAAGYFFTWRFLPNTYCLRYTTNDTSILMNVILGGRWALTT